MGTPYVGEIRMFGGSFAPVGWMFCYGQLVSIADYDTLYNLIGTTYGGDGITVFGLPDLAGRIPIHQGQGTGLSNYVIGQKSGTESVTLTTLQMPQHGHTPVANNIDGNIDAPATNAMPARPKQVVGGNSAQLYTDASKTIAPGDYKPMQAGIIGNVGQNQPHSNLMPTLAIGYIISMFGVYPTQN